MCHGRRAACSRLPFPTFPESRLVTRRVAKSYGVSTPASAPSLTPAAEPAAPEVMAGACPPGAVAGAAGAAVPAVLCVVPVVGMLVSGLVAAGWPPVLPGGVASDGEPAAEARPGPGASASVPVGAGRAPPLWGGSRSGLMQPLRHSAPAHAKRLSTRKFFFMYFRSMLTRASMFSEVGCRARTPHVRLTRRMCDRSSNQLIGRKNQGVLT
jgi:hypothetical protein